VLDAITRGAGNAGPGAPGHRSECRASGASGPGAARRSSDLACL